MSVQNINDLDESIKEQADFAVQVYRYIYLKLNDVLDVNGRAIAAAHLATPIIQDNIQ